MSEEKRDKTEVLMLKAGVKPEKILEYNEQRKKEAAEALARQEKAKAEREANKLTYLQKVKNILADGFLTFLKNNTPAVFMSLFTMASTLYYFFFPK